MDPQNRVFINWKLADIQFYIWALPKRCVKMCEKLVKATKLKLQNPLANQSEIVRSCRPWYCWLDVKSHQHRQDASNGCNLFDKLYRLYPIRMSMLYTCFRNHPKRCCQMFFASNRRPLIFCRPGTSPGWSSTRKGGSWRSTNRFPTTQVEDFFYLSANKTIWQCAPKSWCLNI